MCIASSEGSITKGEKIMLEIVVYINFELQFPKIKV